MCQNLQMSIIGFRKMQFRIILRILSIFLSSYSVTLLVPILIAIGYNEDRTLTVFLQTQLTYLGVGGLFWLLSWGAKPVLQAREGFVLVSGFWSLLAVIGAWPFMMISHLSFADAVFETISGLTTTGATKMVGLDDMPKALLFYRQQIQWFGGLGVVVLAVAILPMLNVGGMKLFKAETPGPMKDEKLTPRMMNTAQSLWLIYVFLTAIAAIAYKIAGMSWFDAIGHSFTAISTGGFSTHDASIGYFNSVPIEVISSVFMLLGAVNFTTHYLAFMGISLRPFRQDSEFLVFIGIVVAATLLIAAVLWHQSVYSSWWTAVRFSSFGVASFISSTGFAASDYSSWPVFLPFLLIVLGYIGGCAGSTAGGTKVIRVILMVKSIQKEIKMALHPNAVVSVKYRKQPLTGNTLDAVRGFMYLYIMVTVVATLLMIASGLDMFSAFSAVAACLNSSGPGFGEVASNFTPVNTFGTWVLNMTMLLGRLELYTVLVIFMPAFWRY
jgi:trk system potassium uptake protein TrkH